MRHTPTCAHLQANRRKRLVWSLVVAFCFAGASAGPAAAADATWTGAGTAAWSDATNWTGTAPTNSAAIGTLTFPQLTSAGCTAITPIGSCYVNNNNLTNLTVNQLLIDAADPYTITGNGITLGAGGLTTLTGNDQGNYAHLNLPITLGADQVWSLNAPSTSLPDYLDLGSALSGAHVLTVSIGNHNAMALNGDSEVGNAMFTGADPAQGCNNGGVDLRTGAKLNATNGSSLTLTNISLQVVGASIGDLVTNASCLELGNLAAQVGVLNAKKVTLDSNSSVDFRVYGTGSSAGTDYAQLNATGAINLAGAKLSISNNPAWPSCGTPGPALGSQYTFVTTIGALTGTFSNAPNGGTIRNGCPGSPNEYLINYNGSTAKATLIAAPATALSVTPANPVTNQTVTLKATITANGGSSSGTVNFQAGGVTIPGCGAQTVSGAVATCQTSFAAASSPIALTALFTQTGSLEAAPIPGTASLTVGKASTTTGVAVSSATPAIGSKVTYTATVMPANTGPTMPSGPVQFRDGSTPIGSCASQALVAGASASKATCTLSYASAGVHSITAKYAGDGSFTGSTSPAETVTAQGRPTLSGGSIRGVGEGSPRLRFIATAGTGAPPLKTIEIVPPAGITFSSRKGIVVTLGNGARAKFKAKVKGGKLTITLTTPTSKVRVSVARKSIRVSHGLRAKDESKKLKALSFGVTLTDSAQTKTNTTLKLPLGKA